MTDQLRQAAQQALEALEGLFGLPNQWESGGVAVWRLGGSSEPRKAITALKAALEQQAEPPPEWPLIKNILDEYGLDAIAFVTAWKAVQQRAEPVAQRPWVGLKEEDWEHIDNKKGTLLDTFVQGATWAEVQLRERNT